MILLVLDLEVAVCRAVLHIDSVLAVNELGKLSGGSGSSPCATVQSTWEHNLVLGRRVGGDNVGKRASDLVGIGSALVNDARVAADIDAVLLAAEKRGRQTGALDLVWAATLE